MLGLANVTSWYLSIWLKLDCKHNFITKLQCMYIEICIVTRVNRTLNVVTAISKFIKFPTFYIDKTVHHKQCMVPMPNFI